MELSLPLMPAVCANRVDTEGDFLNYVVGEIDRTLLVVLLIYLQSSDSGCVINCCELIAADPSVIVCLQGQELDIDLDVVAGNSFGVATSVNGSAAYLARQRTDPVALECTINTRARGLEAVVTLKIPRDPSCTSRPERGKEVIRHSRF